MLLDHRLVLIARVLGKDTTDDDALARQLIGALDALIHHDLHLQASLLEACHEGAALLIGKEAQDALRYLLPYLIDSDKFFECSILQALHGAEGTS